MKGILGRKIGMTQVFTEDGILIPVTVVEATPNIVLQKREIQPLNLEKLPKIQTIQ